MKNRINREKHGIDFSEIETVFVDPWAWTAEDRIHEEPRWQTIGMDGRERVLVVAYTWRAGVIRIISARRASPGERQRYEERR
ncbi:MAG: BrnT family toxin [Rhodanobacteraceae bacterium]